MKKLFVFAIAAGLFFVACNSGASEATNDSTATTAVDTLAAPTVDTAAVADTTAADTTAAPADSAAHH